MSDPRLGFHTDHCRCSPATGGCGEYFNSTFAFDRHRTGQPGLDRRCLTEHEMLAAGMSRNASGYWISRSLPAPRVAAVTRPAPQGAAISTAPLPKQHRASLRGTFHQ